MALVSHPFVLFACKSLAITYNLFYLEHVGTREITVKLLKDNQTYSLEHNLRFHFTLQYQ